MSKDERNTYTIQADESLVKSRSRTKCRNDRRSCGNGSRRRGVYGGKRYQRADQQAWG